MSHQGRGENPRTQAWDTYKERHKTPITSGLLPDFEPRECVAVSRTTCVHGQSYELADVRDSLPEQGAESPGSSEPEPSEDETNIESDSWFSFTRARLNDVLRGSVGEANGDESRDSGPDRNPKAEPTVDATGRLGDDESDDPLDQTTANTAVTSPNEDRSDLLDLQDESDGTDQDQNPTDNVGDLSPDKSPNLNDDEAESAEKIDSESHLESDAAETEDQDKTESEERGHDPAGFM